MVPGNPRLLFLLPPYILPFSSSPKAAVNFPPFCCSHQNACFYLVVSTLTLNFVRPENSLIAMPPLAMDWVFKRCFSKERKRRGSTSKVSLSHSDLCKLLQFVQSLLKRQKGLSSYAEKRYLSGPSVKFYNLSVQIYKAFFFRLLSISLFSEYSSMKI